MIHSKIYTKCEQLPENWNSLVEHDLLLQTSYLRALESSTPDTITLNYVGVFNENELVGVALLQRARLYAEDMFRGQSTSVLKQFVKVQFSKLLKGNILVVGNLTHTGQHGIYFDKDKIIQSQFIQELFKAIDDFIIQIKSEHKKKIRAILFKDYFDFDHIHHEESTFDEQRFYHVNVQPNMLLQIRSDWHDMVDYVSNLSTKYRTRYKRARKKMSNVKLRELTLEEITVNSPKLYELYKNVSDNASFNTFILPENHFYQLKLNLKNNFMVFIYEMDGEIVGFYTLIINKNVLETYFLGYDQEHQYKNQLYLNMLYDMIGYGISAKLSTVVYARTAMEIKSSVGAKPINMSIYIKHTNKLINALLNPIFKLMNPGQQWDERHPFKD